MNSKVALKSDQDVQKDQKLKKKVKNVFTYMESTFQTNGPKSLLYKSIKENSRIKVWTRSHSYVRSICTGYLVAFDQYWNLAMIDVDEVYRIPINKIETDLDKLPKELEKANLEDSEHIKKINTDFQEIESKLNLYKSGRFNLFERHVNQLFIRGDNIVTVTLAD
ncbi:unnamed protein product [Brachionus calyciflorus]|uniref:Sm domain-containing protein n=1 Tax=Brachionus calyciflorus TaxID=104777 RepID=A0A814NEC2_9BILA|nr:unnamed protein product [Brachionus calyciflorus]